MAKYVDRTFEGEAAATIQFLQDLARNADTIPMIEELFGLNLRGASTFTLN